MSWHLGASLFMKVAGNCTLDKFLTLSFIDPLVGIGCLDVKPLSMEDYSSLLE